MQMHIADAQLQERQKWQVEKKDLEVGELVLCHVENTPRGSWPLARVIQTEGVHNLRKGKSNEVRSVVIKFANGKVTRRPVQHLVKLKID